MAVARRGRYAKRFRAVAEVLVRHGFGYLVEQLGLTELAPSLAHGRTPAADDRQPGLSRGERVRRVLEELGPTFVKMGQVLSTRPDVLPKDIRRELSRLLDQVPPFPFAQVQATAERELGQPLADVFPHFDREPLAAASIGQVHRARLRGGEEVVVKVQRPGIESVIAVDLDVLRAIARLAEKRTAWGGLYRVGELVEELHRTLVQEMDYTAEGRNAERFRENLADEEGVYIPKVYWEYSTPRVLTMEYVPGVKVGDVARLREQGRDLARIARNISRTIVRQILIDGHFHADPHPGNIAVLEGDTIALMDFGMVGRLSEERRRQLVQLVLGLVRKNSAQITRAIADMDIVGGDVDADGLRRDVDRVRERYYEASLSRVRLGEAIGDILDLAFKYRIRIPPEFGLVAKALITLEGVVSELDPEFSIAEVAEPFGRRLVRDRLRRLLRDAAGYAWDTGDILLGLPGRMDRLLRQLEDGRLTLKLEHAEIRESLSRLDRISNRLSFSVILLGFSIIMAGLVVASALASGTGRGFLWMRLPVLEIGSVLAVFMGGWLLLAILRSGWF